MITRITSSQRRAVQLFEPGTESLYTLEGAARVGGVARRTILIYCRAGLVVPAPGAPPGALYFDDEAINAIHQLETLRTRYGVNLEGARLMIDMAREIERLRREVRQARD